VSPTAADVLRLLAEALADDARRVLRALADSSLSPEPALERLALTAWNAAVMLCDELKRRAGEAPAPEIPRADDGLFVPPEAIRRKK
jgi:hypothetical protein